MEGPEVMKGRERTPDGERAEGRPRRIAQLSEPHVRHIRALGQTYALQASQMGRRTAELHIRHGRVAQRGVVQQRRGEVDVGEPLASTECVGEARCRQPSEARQAEPPERAAQWRQGWQARAQPGRGEAHSREVDRGECRALQHACDTLGAASCTAREAQRVQAWHEGRE